MKRAHGRMNTTVDNAFAERMGTLKDMLKWFNNINIARGVGQ